MRAGAESRNQKVRAGLEAALNRLGRLRQRLLEAAGERRVFLVGGAIRDVLLDGAPSDFDFAVSGSGLGFGRLFSRRAHGKLVVLSREQDEVRVVARGLVLDFNGLGDRTIEEDLARRDFTVNAMACELLPECCGELSDPFHGQADSAARVVRPVSERSLELDPLRLLRAVRLALELGFRVDESVFAQAQQISLKQTAGERVGAELLRILEAPGSYEYVVRLHEAGRLKEVLSEFGPVLADDRLREHSFRTYLKLEELVSGRSFFSGYEPEWREYFERWGAESEDEPGFPYRRAMLKLCGLLHDIAKPETEFATADGDVHFYGHDSLGARIAARMVRDRLRLSRQQVKMVRTQVQEHMRLHLLATSPELTDRAIRRFFRDLGEEAFGVMMLCYADGWATAGRTSHLEKTMARMIEQKRAEDEKRKFVRFVDGHDLIALGLEPGPAFKVILQELEDLQLEGRIGSKEEGIEYLKATLPGTTKRRTQDA